MCEAGRDGNQREYQSLEECWNASEIVNILSGWFVGLRAAGASTAGGVRP